MPTHVIAIRFTLAENVHTYIIAHSTPFSSPHAPAATFSSSCSRLLRRLRKKENAKEQKKKIFDPIPRVEGVGASSDPLLEMRATVYLISGRERRAT